MIVCNFGKWLVVIGAILNMMMFLFISIPMAERNLAKYKSCFEEYKKSTRMILPLKKNLNS